MEGQSILSEQKKIALLECAKWARILGIATIVSIGISFVSSIVTMGASPFGIAGALATTVIGGSISVAGAILLLYFYKHITTGARGGDTHSVDRALYNFKWYFGLLGILLVLALSFMCLGVVFSAMFNM